MWNLFFHSESFSNPLLSLKFHNGRPYCSPFSFFFFKLGNVSLRCVLVLFFDHFCLPFALLSTSWNFHSSCIRPPGLFSNFYIFSFPCLCPFVLLCEIFLTLCSSSKIKDFLFITVLISISCPLFSNLLLSI